MNDARNAVNNFHVRPTRRAGLPTRRLAVVSTLLSENRFLPSSPPLLRVSLVPLPLTVPRRRARLVRSRPVPSDPPSDRLIVLHGSLPERVGALTQLCRAFF